MKNCHVNYFFTSSMSTDIKLRKSQLTKIIQSGILLCKTLGNMISNLGEKALLDLAATLDKDANPKLAAKPTSSALDKFEKKTSERGAVRAGK